MKRATGNDGSNKVGGLVPTLEKKKIEESTVIFCFRRNRTAKDART